MIGNLPCQIDGDGEADVHGDRRIQDGGIDADDLALEVEQRAARVALIDGGVGLDEVLVLRDSAPEHAVLGADDAHGDGLAQAKRVADGEHVVPHAHLFRVADLHRPQIGRWMVDLHHRHVGRGIAAHHAGLEAPLVGKLNPHLIGANHDMVVGQHDARLANHEARAQPVLGLTTRGCPAEPEAIAKELHRRILADHPGQGLAALNGHHRGLDTIHERCDRGAKLGWRRRELGQQRQQDKGGKRHDPPGDPPTARFRGGPDPFLASHGRRRCRAWDRTASARP